jgi:hypothetical protein
MKRKAACSHCGAKMVEYKHGLSKAQVRPLVRLMNAGGGPLNISDDITLNKSEYTNFAKLAYWGLVEKEGDSKRGGRWQITAIGRRFLGGEVTLQKTAWVYRGVVQRFDGPELSIMDVTGGWKYRPDYARESVPHDPQLGLI